MTLTAGTRLGPYAITVPLGADPSTLVAVLLSHHCAVAGDDRVSEKGPSVESRGVSPLMPAIVDVA